ncbi:hypothetical protein D3C85_1498930 [compost metagenome]
MLMERSVSVGCPSVDIALSCVVCPERSAEKLSVDVFPLDVPLPTEVELTAPVCVTAAVVICTSILFTSLRI